MKLLYFKCTIYGVLFSYDEGEKCANCDKLCRNNNWLESKLGK